MILRTGRPTISVVIPIYNGADYLESAVESVLSDGLSGVEIVMVDDGSTDGSLDVARRLIAAHPESALVLVQQPENGGVSRARNRGIEVATRDYVTFLDADDLVAPQGLTRMLALADDTDADVVAGNIETFRQEGEEVRYKRYWGLEHQGVYRYEMSGRLSSMPRLVYSVSAWAKLYRRSFLLEHGIRFPDGIHFAEDQPVALRSLALAERISICPDVVYHYRLDNQASAMRATFRLSRFERIRDLVRANLEELDGWPRYFYTRRALDYEILQNVRRIGVLPWGEARLAFEALREAFAACDPEITREFVEESSQYRRDYEALLHGRFRTARLRHADPMTRVRQTLAARA